MYDLVWNFMYSFLTYYLVFLGSYYIPSLILFLIDLKKWFTDYKIQKAKVDDIMGIYKKCLPNILVNTILLPIPMIGVLILFQNVLGFEFSILKMGFDFLVGLFLTDIFFYTGHKLFHHPKLYKKYHKKHHEITAPIGISALYMTPPDLYFGNIIPVYLPMIILSAHPYTIYLWMILTTVNTVVLAHSGFKNLAEFHDIHHKYFTKNYGINIFMDKILGTFYIGKKY